MFYLQRNRNFHSSLQQTIADCRKSFKEITIMKLSAKLLNSYLKVVIQKPIDLSSKSFDWFLYDGNLAFNELKYVYFGRESNKDVDNFVQLIVFGSCDGEVQRKIAERYSQAKISHENFLKQSLQLLIFLVCLQTLLHVILSIITSLQHLH